MTPPKVIFFPVKDTSTKLQAIVGVATHCFYAKTRLLFSVATYEAARYVDELLWKFPSESFLPHAILSRPSIELIGITMMPQNLNQAAVLFNLCPEASPLVASVSIIYDFIDETHPSKLEQALKRKEFYLRQGFTLSF